LESDLIFLFDSSSINSFFCRLEVSLFLLSFVLSMIPVHPFGRFKLIPRLTIPRFPDCSPLFPTIQTPFVSNVANVILVFFPQIAHLPHPPRYPLHLTPLYGTVALSRFFRCSQPNHVSTLFISPTTFHHLLSQTTVSFSFPTGFPPVLPLPPFFSSDPLWELQSSPPACPF